MKYTLRIPKIAKKNAGINILMPQIRFSCHYTYHQIFLLTCPSTCYSLPPQPSPTPFLPHIPNIPVLICTMLTSFIRYLYYSHIPKTYPPNIPCSFRAHESIQIIYMHGYRAV